MENRMNFPCLGNFEFICNREEDLYDGEWAFSLWREFRVGY